jgi:hypothetical protein
MYLCLIDPKLMVLKGFIPPTTRYPELSVLTEMALPMIFFPLDEEAQDMTVNQVWAHSIVFDRDEP